MPPPTKAKLWSQRHWLFLLPIPLLWCLLSHYGALRQVENRTLDWRFHYRGELKPPVKVIYADVDSLSLDTIGNMPWDRTYFLRVSEALVAAAGVRAVGFDFIFSDTGIAESADLRKIVRGNIAFGQFLRREPPVVLAAGYEGWRFLDELGKKQERRLPIVATEQRALKDIQPPEVPQFATTADPDHPTFWSPPFCGLIDTMDNDTRLVPAYAPTATRTYFHLGFELARLYWRLPPGSIHVHGDEIRFVDRDGAIVSSVPLLNHQMLEVNWFTRWNSPYTYHFEFSDLYNYAEALTSKDPDERAAAKTFFADPTFKDAVVLVGPVDPLLQDLAPTPLDDRSVPRVGVHGNVLMTILSGRYLRHVPGWATYAITFALALLMAWLAVAGGARAALAKLGALLLAAAYVVVTFHVFSRWQLVLPFTAPLGAAFTTSFAGLIWQVMAEQKAKSRIKGMFGTYLAPTVVEQMLESGKDPELGGHDAEITAYFSDIQSFSSFSEVLGSAKLTDLLNEFLTACTDIVQGQRGTLDKYIGDAVVAMFGAPVDAADHAYRACVSALLVQRQVAELREKWRAEGEKWPVLVHHLRTRIGLNTGVCMIGNMGSRTRFNYTMMGDNVNLAARMESGAKSWGVYTMCAESTKRACTEVNPDAIVFRALGRIVVMGRTQPVPIYEVVGLQADVTAPMRECIAHFEDGLQKYWSRDWTGAVASFEKSRALEWLQPGRDGGVVTNASIVYLTKIIPETCAENLPADWDGRYVMHEK